MSRKTAGNYLFQAKVLYKNCYANDNIGDGKITNTMLLQAQAAALIAIAEVLMDDDEEDKEPEQKRELKTEFKDKFWKEEDKKDDSEQPADATKQT